MVRDTLPLSPAASLMALNAASCADAIGRQWLISILSILKRRVTHLPAGHVALNDGGRHLEVHLYHVFAIPLASVLHFHVDADLVTARCHSASDVDQSSFERRVSAESAAEPEHWLDVTSLVPLVAYQSAFVVVDVRVASAVVVDAWEVALFGPGGLISDLYSCLFGMVSGHQAGRESLWLACSPLRSSTLRLDRLTPR